MVLHWEPPPAASCVANQMRLWTTKLSGTYTGSLPLRGRIGDGLSNALLERESVHIDGNGHKGDENGVEDAGHDGGRYVSLKDRKNVQCLTSSRGMLVPDADGKMG